MVLPLPASSPKRTASLSVPRSCAIPSQRANVEGCSFPALSLPRTTGCAAPPLTTFHARTSRQSSVSRNSVSDGTPSVVIQGAGGAGNLQQNTVKVRLHENQADIPPEQAVLISNGRAGNHAEVLAGSQAYTRTDKDLLR